MVTKTKKDLLSKIAALESINDQLITELGYIDMLMRRIGFSEGLKSVKDTAREIIEDGEEDYPNETSLTDDEVA